MKNEQNKTPLFDTLYNHAKRQVISFHTPGHKNGRSIDSKLRSFTGRNAYYFDVTVFPEVDSLHDPTGSIKKAQELYAKLCNVKYTFFLVNGSSSGNIAMFLSAFNPGDSVIVSRNCHKSILSAIILSGVWPIWVQPKIDSNLDIIFDMTVKQVEDAIKQFPEAQGVFITSPTYNGITTDLIEIAKLCHQNDMIFLVDEAHGSHLKFHEDLPISAVEAGADMCVQSVHKTLSALSQGSVLHFNSEIVDFNRTRKVVSMLQTTSPNYFILSSIDLARKQAYENGEKMLEKVISASEETRKKINRLKNFFCFTRKEIQAKGYDLDVTKLTVNVTRSGLTGYEVEDILAKEYNIQVDCADMFNIIAITGIGTSRSDTVSLYNALEEIDTKYQSKNGEWFLELPSLTTEMVMLPRDVFFGAKTKRIPLSKAYGQISAQSLTPYPPGIPVLIPGERITKEICNYVTELSKKDIRISGQETDQLKTIKVVAT